MKHEIKHPAEIIADTMTRLYQNRLTTTSGGNLSVMDENGTLWISPTGVDKEHLTRDDIMSITPDGKIHGRHRPSTEYPFHLAILRARPDLKVVLHAHPAGLVAYSLERMLPEINLIPEVAKLCGKIAIAKYALPGSKELGDLISEQFINGCDTVLLENHAVALGADSMEKAYMMLESLELAANIGVCAGMLKEKTRVLSKEDLEVKESPFKYNDSLIPSHPNSEEADARNQIVKMMHRSYRNKLFTAGTGTFATRLSDGSFIVSPEDEDRATITAEMLVKVNGSDCEKDKLPSNYTSIISNIFKANPDVNTVAIARPPHIMGFAVSDAVFNSHMIPEGYICLKNTLRYPYGTIEKNESAIVESINIKSPIAIVENDCVIVAGTSPLNAYDRLEVLEFGATSLCYIQAMNGSVVPISEDKIKEIEVAFNL